MLLEGLLQSIMEEALRRTILILIAQMNLLLCLVNDVLDLRMIEEGKFNARNEMFDPSETLKFISDIFMQQLSLQNSQLSIEIVSYLSHADPEKRVMNPPKEQNVTLPDHLFGDQIRLKQVLVNLTKNALKFSYNKPIKIKACYNRRRKLLEVHVID